VNPKTFTAFINILTHNYEYEKSYANRAIEKQFKISGIQSKYNIFERNIYILSVHNIIGEKRKLSKS